MTSLPPTSDAPAVASPPSYSPLSDRDAITASSRDYRQWSLAQRLGFRFVFVYLLLYTFPGPVSELPFTDFIGNGYYAVWKVVVPWFGAHVLSLSHPVSTQPSGSGDKLFDWVQLVVMLAVAAIAAGVWTALERGKRSHPKLLEAFALYLRFTLARTMFSYGFDKIFPNQFSPMNPTRLVQYFGEASPGGFAWTFLGFSIPYEIFAGVSETVAASFLLFRRTRTLGAVIGAAVLTNVFMLNMTFDIPVKQYSGHLLLMCVFLVALDADRLFDLFVRGRAAAAPHHFDLFTTRRTKIGAWAVGIALSLWMIGGTAWREWKGLHEYGRLAPRGPLYGIFEVEEVTKNGAVQPPLLTDATLWRRFASGNRGTMVRLATDSLVRYGLTTDSVKHLATLRWGADTANKYVLAYAFPDSMHLVFRGRMGADSVEMKLRRRPENSYMLMSRGFHWVNEIPFFR